MRKGQRLYKEFNSNVGYYIAGIFSFYNYFTHHFYRSAARAKAVSLIACLLCISVFAQQSVSQTIVTVGTGGNYTTLKGAFDDINAGSITGNIILQITTSTTERLLPNSMPAA